MAGKLEHREYFVMVFDPEQGRVSVNGSPFVRFGGFKPSKSRHVPYVPPQEPPKDPPGKGDPVCGWEQQDDGSWCWVCEENGVPISRDCEF